VLIDFSNSYNMKSLSKEECDRYNEYEKEIKNNTCNKITKQKVKEIYEEYKKLLQERKKLIELERAK